MIDEVVSEYNAIRGEYEPDESIFREDDERTHRAKMLVEHKLDEPEKIIIRMYAELGSYRKLGQMLGCSYVLARSQVERIRKKLHDAD